jgi:hypothetical protein
MTKKLFAASAMVLIAALVLPSTAFAAEPNQGHVVMGGNYTLEAGETLDGDLVVFGGNAEIQEDSTVQGSVLLLGGNADVNGTVQGELALVGGNADLGPSAVIQGNVVSLGGNLQRAPGSEISGDVVTADEFSVPFSFPRLGTTRIIGPFEGANLRFSPIWSVLWFFFRSLLLAALAILVVMFWPKPTARAASAVVGQPILAGGLGLLTFIVAPILLLVLAITIILSPVSLLAFILLVVAGVFGWIAVGLEVGDRLAEAFKWEIHPAASAGLGTLAMSLVVGGIGLVPCIGWLAGFIVVAMGLGAVLLTRFGSREYVPATAQAMVPAEPAPKTATRRTSSRSSRSTRSKSGGSEK